MVEEIGLSTLGFYLAVPMCQNATVTLLIGRFLSNGSVSHSSSSWAISCALTLRVEAVLSCFAEVAGKIESETTRARTGTAGTRGAA